jgi:hypothetical protein
MSFNDIVLPRLLALGPNETLKSIVGTLSAAGAAAAVNRVDILQRLVAASNVSLEI